MDDTPTGSQPFPEGLALGDAFLNREIERKLLARRIQSHQHTILMGPRRYGKTSLVNKVSEEMKMPYCAIDLFAAYSTEYVRDQIVDKVGHLVFELLPRLKKAKESLISIFKQMKPEISLGAFGQKLTLHVSNNPLKDLTDVLLRLDETAKKFKKRAVIFLDEFQQISQLPNYHSIEASIRHAVERSQHIAYVFSGSNRQLLQQMFGSQGRPLYRLCQTLTIDRMESSVYMDHLLSLSKKKWKKPISIETINEILKLTECHPFYVNTLCQMVWEEKTPPDTETVAELWDRYVKTQRAVIAHDILELSVNQRRILSALSKAPTKSIQSAEFTGPLKISASSSQQSLDVLMSKDLVMQRKDGYYGVLDPAMRYYLDVVLWDPNA